jgi:hypothetical protein
MQIIIIKEESNKEAMMSLMMMKVKKTGVQPTVNNTTETHSDCYRNATILTHHFMENLVIYLEIKMIEEIKI